MSARRACRCCTRFVECADGTFADCDGPDAALLSNPMTETASAQPAIAGVSQGGALPRGAVGVGAYYLAHFLAAVFPVTAGLLLYGCARARSSF